MLPSIKGWLTSPSALERDLEGLPRENIDLAHHSSCRLANREDGIAAEDLARGTCDLHAVRDVRGDVIYAERFEMYPRRQPAR